MTYGQPLSSEVRRHRLTVAALASVAVLVRVAPIGLAASGAASATVVVDASGNIIVDSRPTFIQGT